MTTENEQTESFQVPLLASELKSTDTELQKQPFDPAKSVDNSNSLAFG